MTLGNTDLEVASREVGVPAEEGMESVTTALAALESSLGQSIDEVERRMHDLGAVTDTLEMPESTAVRTAAKRGRQRNTVLLVAAAIAIILGGGFVATDGDVLTSQAALPYREKIGAERPDVVLDAQKLDAGNLLRVKQVDQLDAGRRWKVDNTDDDITNTTPYATCPTKRFADKDPLKVFVRTFSANGTGNERVAQSIEVSKSDAVASQAYNRLVQWYSDCEHPRTQLVAAYTVKRPFGDFQILRLRSHRSPDSTFTVGFSHSGTVTSTLVHEADGARGPDIEAFARTLNDSVSRVCADSGGTCTDNIEVMRTDPPRTSKAPEFLGIVDLPPIADIDRVWAAAEFPARSNPAATLCDRADFTDDDVTKASSRIFVLYKASELPKEFGVAETVARFGSEKKAEDFVKKIDAKIEKCPDAKFSAELGERESIDGNELDGKVWRVGLEIKKGKRVFYRTSIVRRGADVAQVTFTPAKGYDISQEEFTSVAARAGTRLRYLDAP